MTEPSYGGGGPHGSARGVKRKAPMPMSEAGAAAACDPPLFGLDPQYLPVQSTASISCRSSRIHLNQRLVGAEQVLVLHKGLCAHTAKAATVQQLSGQRPAVRPPTTLCPADGLRGAAARESSADTVHACVTFAARLC